MIVRRQKSQDANKFKQIQVSLLFSQKVMPDSNQNRPWTLALNRTVGFLNCPVVLGSKVVPSTVLLCCPRALCTVSQQYF